MDRSQARVAAMQLIYEWEMHGDGGEETLVGMLEIQPDDKNVDYMESLFSGVTKNAPEIDSLIAAYLRPGWKLERISRVDLCILRLGVYELKYLSTPQAVVINEAVEMSKQFSTEEIGSFINGVLGNIARSLIKAAEQA